MKIMDFSWKSIFCIPKHVFSIYLFVSKISMKNIVFSMKSMIFRWKSWIFDENLRFFRWKSWKSWIFNENFGFFHENHGFFDENHGFSMKIIDFFNENHWFFSFIPKIDFSFIPKYLKYLLCIRLLLCPRWICFTPNWISICLCVIKLSSKITDARWKSNHGLKNIFHVWKKRYSFPLWSSEMEIVNFST